MTTEKIKQKITAALKRFADKNEVKPMNGEFVISMPLLEKTEFSTVHNYKKSETTWYERTKPAHAADIQKWHKVEDVLTIQRLDAAYTTEEDVISHPRIDYVVNNNYTTPVRIDIPFSEIYDVLIDLFQIGILAPKFLKKQFTTLAKEHNVPVNKIKAIIGLRPNSEEDIGIALYVGSEQKGEISIEKLIGQLETA